MGAVKVPGKAVELGGRELILAPLNAATCKQYRDQLGAVFTDGGLPDIELVCKLVHASAARNHDDVTLEWLLEYVDMGNYVDLLDTVVNVSGLVASVGKMLARMNAATVAITSTTP